MTVDSRARLLLANMVELHIVSAREVALITGVEIERVADWISGDVMPEPHERAALAVHFRILDASWDIAPFGSNEDDGR